MQVTVGYSNHPDSTAAGKEAAQSALAKAGCSQSCDMVLLFATARHNQLLLREAVSVMVGEGKPIYGGGAAGIITNDQFGYAGDQVGVACIWLEESTCTVFAETGMGQSETETGRRLGNRFLEAGITKDSSMLLFYDAIYRSGGDMRLLLATWLLEGIENGMGFLPKLMGAGLQGDHACTGTMQYTGEGLEEHAAIGLAFSDDICIDSIIMHGCRPASPYYTVTKAEGSVILEINGMPAIAFIDQVLESAIAPEEYPFFLLFGLNHGEPWGEYEENNYASRLCLDIDQERGGIVMFEPDMTEGVQFQIMFRSLDLDYMLPKIDNLFSQLNGREPFFALYIDCAGRCAGYGGVDTEDALVIQRAVGCEIPLFGIYTGAEIAPIGGHSRGLDLTGVFCLFSKRGLEEKEKKKEEGIRAWRKQDESQSKASETPLEDALRLCEHNAAKVLKLDSQTIAIRHELEQKRRGFSLLAEFSVLLCGGNCGEDMFFPVAQRINGALNMQKTAVLFQDSQGCFFPYVLQGYSEEEKERLSGQPMELEKALFNPEEPVLVTAADEENRYAKLREWLGLPYFISTPIIVKNEVAAILITGRLVEATPFLCRLGRSEVETVQAIGALLASVLVYRKLDDANRQAQSDPLTGLLNRSALKRQVTRRLKEELKINKKFAFFIIDCDFFKDINDRYGHMTGDLVLQSLAEVLGSSFGTNGSVARIGGDEFAVFIELENLEENVHEKAKTLREKWSKTVLEANSGVSISSTISIGIALAPRDGTVYDELFQRADIALYRSKQLGRDQYTIYKEESNCVV